MKLLRESQEKQAMLERKKAREELEPEVIDLEGPLLSGYGQETEKRVKILQDKLKVNKRTRYFLKRSNNDNPGKPERE